MATPNHVRRRSRRVWLWISAVVVAVILLAAFISLRRSELPIREERVTRTAITSTISTNGKIEPVDNFEAHAPLATTVKRVLVHEGDPVHKGQLLLQLDAAGAYAQAARAQAQLRAAEAEVHAVESGGTREEVLNTRSQLEKARFEQRAAQQNLKAMQKLEQTGAASPGEVQQAQARLEQANTDIKLLLQKQTSRFSAPDIEKVRAQENEGRAAYAAANDVIQESNIVAPRDGVVYALPVRPGMFVNAGDMLLQVADLRTVQVRIYVDEYDLNHLAPGEEVDVTWDAIPGRVWQGTLKRIPTDVTLYGTRNVGETTCTIQNPDLRLPPNVSVKVSIITQRRDNALVVPREAVHQHDGRGHVFVYQVVDGVLRHQDVQLGIQNLTEIEVTQGLKDNAAIALEVPGHPIHEDRRVRVVNNQ